MDRFCNVAQHQAVDVISVSWKDENCYTCSVAAMTPRCFVLEKEIHQLWEGIDPKATMVLYRDDLHLYFHTLAIVATER